MSRVFQCGIRALLITSITLATSLSATADSPTMLVECSFRGGVVLRTATKTEQPAEPRSSRFAFVLPAEWKNQFAAIEARASSKWTNLDKGWGGELTAILNGKMLRLLENTYSDNAFYVHVWLDRLKSDGTFEALYLFAGHSDLPKEYGASTLRLGRCKYT